MTGYVGIGVHPCLSPEGRAWFPKTWSSDTSQNSEAFYFMEGKGVVFSWQIRKSEIPKRIIGVAFLNFTWPFKKKRIPGKTELYRGLLLFYPLDFGDYIIDNTTTYIWGILYYLLQCYIILLRGLYYTIVWYFTDTTRCILRILYRLMVHEHPGAFTKDFQDFMVKKSVFVHCSPLDFTNFRSTADGFRNE